MAFNIFVTLSFFSGTPSHRKSVAGGDNMLMRINSHSQAGGGEGQEELEIELEEPSKPIQ